LVAAITRTFTRTGFSDLKVDPANANTVLAATTRGFAGRVSVFPPSLPPRGILKSTDGGQTWSLKLSGEATDLEVDPGNFNRQYAGIGDPFVSSANGVYRSTNGGDTWALVSGPWSSLTAGVGRVELAIAPSNPNVLYVSIQDAINGVGVDGGLLGLWRTDNAWAPAPTWTQIPTLATDDGTGVHGYCGWDPAIGSAEDTCWYAHELIVDPTNASVLFAGGIALWKYNGTSWTEVSKTASNPTNGIKSITGAQHKVVGAEFHDKTGLGMRDMGVVILGNKWTPAFIADGGPFMRLGEGSPRVFEALEQTRCRQWSPDGMRCVGPGGTAYPYKNFGVSKDVIFILYLGSGKPDMTPDNAIATICAFAKTKLGLTGSPNCPS